MGKINLYIKSVKIKSETDSIRIKQLIELLLSGLNKAEKKEEEQKELVISNKISELFTSKYLLTKPNRIWYKNSENKIKYLDETQ